MLMLSLYFLSFLIFMLIDIAFLAISLLYFLFMFDDASLSPCRLAAAYAFDCFIFADAFRRAHDTLAYALSLRRRQIVANAADHDDADA